MHVPIMPPRCHAALELPDGRRLAWHEWGAKSGTVVLFCTGAAMSGRLGFGPAAVERLDLRLIGVDRPGLGASDPHPEKTLASWANDACALLDALGAANVGTVGFSQGAPFALALAASRRVRAAALVSAQDELTHPALRPRLHPDVAAMIAAVREDPERFESTFAGTATADGLRKLVLDTSGERDRRVYGSEMFDACYRDCLDDGFRQGANGYARDLVNALGEWPFTLERISVPIDLWYGAQDTSPVHSPDSGATLAARLPRCTRRLEPDEGGSLLWTRADDILDALSAQLASTPSSVPTTSMTSTVSSDFARQRS